MLVSSWLKLRKEILTDVVKSLLKSKLIQALFFLCSSPVYCQMQKHNRKEKTKCIGRTSTGNQNAEGGKDVDVEIHQRTSQQETRSFNF